VRVVLVTQYDCDIVECGGAETYLRNLATGLRKRGHEVTFATSNAAVSELISDGGGDIFHFHTAMAYPDVSEQSVMLVKTLAIPYCFTLHDYWPICVNRMMVMPKQGNNPHICGDTLCESCNNQCGFYIPNPYWFQLLRFAPCICQTQSSQDMFSRHGLMNTHLITNAIDAEAFAPGEFDADNKRVLFISAHGQMPWKGWNQWERIKPLIPEAEIVEVIGGVPYADMPEVYRNAAVFVFCSMYHETTGMAALESMACGTPIVANAVGGLRNNVIDGETGFLVDRNDAQSAANRVNELLSNPEKRRQMGLNARQHILDNFKIDVMVDRQIEFYERTIRGETVYGQKVSA